MVTLILFAGLCFVIQLVLARPDWRAASTGVAPSAELPRDADGVDRGGRPRRNRDAA